MPTAVCNQYLIKIMNELAQNSDDQVIYATLGSEQKCDDSL